MFSVLSMSARHPDGDDAAYLEWHMLDHLPEQYRIAAIRSGQRWVSTARCRKARLVSKAPFDAVDHLVSYLFADDALDEFFRLGGELRGLDRMPILLPRIHVGIWDLVDKAANPAALVAADVVPWRPNRGVYLILDRTGSTDAAAALACVDGVAGVWRFQGTSGRHARAQDCGEIEATICYLDGDPVGAAEAIAAHILPGESMMLAAPFESMVPFDWDRVLP
ncbi:MAG TPA: hypothetical protein VGJ86_19730 [Acidimicrobiales bacterium]|jgi:hypothetical protein